MEKEIMINDIVLCCGIRFRVVDIYERDGMAVFNLHEIHGSTRLSAVQRDCFVEIGSVERLFVDAVSSNEDYDDIKEVMSNHLSVGVITEFQHAYVLDNWDALLKMNWDEILRNNEILREIT